MHRKPFKKTIYSAHTKDLHFCDTNLFKLLPPSV